MEQKLLTEEIGRIKKLMLLEGPGSGILSTFRSYGIRWSDKNKICDDLLDAGFDDSSVNVLRGKRNADEFTDELYNQLNTLSRGTDLGETSQFHSLLKGLSKSFGLDTKLDDVLNVLKDSTKSEAQKGAAITTFLANFQDAQVQEFFEKSIKQIESDSKNVVDRRTLTDVVRGKLDDITAGKNLDDMFEGTPLTDRERFAIRKGRIKNQSGDILDDSLQPKPFAIIEHMYNYAKQIEQVTLNAGAKALTKQEELVNKVYNRLLDIIKTQSKNENFSDIQTQFAQIWNEINNMRLLQQTKGKNMGGQIKSGDAQWTSDIFKEFTKTLKKQNVPYEMINKLDKWWETASPMTRNTWYENVAKNTAWARFLATKNPISDLINGMAKLWSSTVGVLVDKGIDVLLTGNPMFARREQIEKIYKMGLFVPKGSYKIKGKKIIPKIGGVYSQWVKGAFMSVYVFIPAIITLFILAKDSILFFINFFSGGGTETGNQSYWKFLVKRALDIFTSHIREKGVFGNIKTFIEKSLFPFNPLIDDVIKGLWDVASETKDIVFTSTDTIIDRIKKFVYPIWEKIISAYESTKNKVQDRINIENTDEKYSNDIDGFKLYLKNEKMPEVNPKKQGNNFLNGTDEYKFIDSNRDNKGKFEYIPQDY